MDNNFNELKGKTIILIILSVLVIAACAKMGSLSGGIRDEIPPKIVSCKPENYSVGFNGRRIEITFNEFIVLKDINRELVISPPLKEKPDVRLRNKTISIDLNNELKENTTYTLNFGKAIADNNEGNPLTNYEFVFSTGNYLDSLSIEGRIVNSFDLQPSKDPVTIMLYKNLEDSIPLKEIPVYIGKTDVKGMFRINNLNSDTYKVFAIKDQNFNFLFDLPNEEIAYLDTFITLTPDFFKTYIRKPDTTFIDTIKSKALPKDTLNVSKNDSVTRKYSLPAIYIDLYLFTEDSRVQYLANNQRNIPEHLEFSFNLPLKDLPRINPINFSPSDNWYLPEVNSKRDTFHLWLKDSTLIRQDTLRLSLVYPAPDSLGRIYEKIDTIIFLYRKPLKAKTRRSDEKAGKEPSKLTVSTIRDRSNQGLNSNIPFGFNFPLDKIDTSLIHLVHIVDSVENRFPYIMSRDSISLRKAYLKGNWLEKSKFQLRIFPGAFKDIYGNVNDTIKPVFSTNENASYGTLIMKLSDIKTPMIIQLMNEGETVLQEKYSVSDTTMNFPFLNPTKYKLKFIIDRNGNRKWDTGNYLKKIQPEEVSYFKGELNVRSNWELEVNWKAGTDQ